MSLTETSQQWDRWLLLAMHAMSRYPLFDQACGVIDASSLLRATLPIAAYWYFWFAAPSRDSQSRDRRRIVLAGIAGSLLAVILARTLADLLPFRVRPFFDPASGFPLRTDTIYRTFENWSAFPSDTAAFVFSLSLGLYRVAPRLSLAFAVYSVVVVCGIRVYLGIHYPSDILAGCAVAVVAAGSCQKFVRGAAVEWILDCAERHRGWFYAFAFILTSELAVMFQNTRDIGRLIIREVHALPVAAQMHIAEIGAALALAACAVGWVALRRGAKGQKL